MRIYILVVLAVCFISVPALAQNYSQTFDEISRVNRIRPLQNPDYDRTDQVLGRRIMDRKNKVLGEIHDIILNKNGTILFLNVDFNRLHLNSKVFLNYRAMNVRPVSNGYALSNYDDNQIRALYPSMLADIETASGDDDESYSLRKLIGAQIKAEDGRSIGRVEDILFGYNGGHAEAIYIALKYKTLRRKNIAIPFNMAEIKPSFRGKSFVITNVDANSIIDYVKQQR